MYTSNYNVYTDLHPFAFLSAKLLKEPGLKPGLKSSVKSDALFSDIVVLLLVFLYTQLHLLKAERHLATYYNRGKW